MIGCSPCSDPVTEAYEPKTAVGKAKSQWWILIQYGVSFKKATQGCLTSALQAPTIQTIFENWATNSLAAQQKDREQFLRQVMGEDKNKEYDMDGVMEILLRMVRGRDQHHQDGGGFQASHHHHNFNVSNALFQAASPGPAIAQHQTPASLAVLALFRALQDFGVRLSGEEGKREANEWAKSVLRMMPQNTLFRSLDGMFREWYSEKRGHR